MVTACGERGVCCGVENELRRRQSEDSSIPVPGGRGDRGRAGQPGEHGFACASTRSVRDLRAVVRRLSTAAPWDPRQDPGVIDGEDACGGGGDRGIVGKLPR